MATLAPGAAFGLYALPNASLARNAISVTAVGTGSPGGGDIEDAEYPGLNMLGITNTGHLNLPSRPAKMTAYEGYWEVTFSAPVTANAVAFIYTNWDGELDVTLEPDGGTPISIDVPAPWENGWWPSPWKQFDEQTSDVWRIRINEPNSLLPQLGTFLLYGPDNGLRDLGNDVRWGVEEVEIQGQIEHTTEGGVELLYELFGPRRSFHGEFYLKNATASELLTLYRSARNRIQPWLLIPDENINDAWFVRFLEPQWSRTRDNPDNNIFPFRVKELSRGLPHP